MENLTSEQQLDQLLKEGKINKDEYKQLLSVMNKSSIENTSFINNIEHLKRMVPNLLWIALVSLALMILLKIAYVSQTGPLILIDAAISTVLLFGIYLGHKWAYFFTIIFVLLGTVSGLSKGLSQGMTIFIIDCLVLVPVLLCTDYFFPKSK